MRPYRRLKKDDGYQKPEMTYTEKLTQEEIEDKLDNYTEVEDLSKVPLGTHIRYITNIKGQKKFRIGGVLVNTKGLPTYIVLASGNGKTWSVQTKGTVFYRELSRDEIKEEYEEVIDELEGQLEKYQKTIDNLKDMIRLLKTENAELKKKR